MTLFHYWITNGTSHPFYVRKEIMIDRPFVRASAFVCGLGQFIFSINGEKVGDHELDPGWTDYRKYIEYVCFDVTGLLHEGTNALGGEVGNGWFIMDDAGGYSFHFPSFMPPNPNPYKPFGTELVFALKLFVEYQDGTGSEFITDSSWKTAPHEVCRSNVYGSSVVDLALAKPDFSVCGFDDSDWDFALLSKNSILDTSQLVEQFQPPIKVIQTYPARFLHTVSLKNSEHYERKIFDFGQNMSGILEFDLRGKKGTTICIYPAEKLSDDGDADQMAKNWMLIDSKITVTIGKDNEWQHFRQKFEYFAGRYLAVEFPVSYSDQAEGARLYDCEIRNLTAHAISGAWKNSGSFISDDDRYNQIYHLVEKAVEANMVSVHTDCPTIERFAWQEPNHLMGGAILFMKDGRKLWEKFLLDMRMAQHTASDTFYDFTGRPFYPGDGLVPSQCPCYIPNVLPVPGMGSFYDIIPWGSSIILAAGWHYLFYGDLQVIRDNYPAGVRYLNHLKTKLTPDGFINHGLGDWGNPDHEYARENIETAFLYADAMKLAEFADLLGLSEEAVNHRAFAEKIRANYNEKLLARDPEGRWAYRSWEKKPAYIITQACQALPLYFDMVPDDKRADVEAAFHETLVRKNCFASGEVGLPYIIQTARRLGMNDLIADFITRPDHPSYYAFVLDGLTTLGEYWENNPRSQCHDMMGHIIEWYYNGIAGIEILEAGFKKISIHPFMPDGMNHFLCTYRAPQGEIRVEGKRVNGIPEFTYTLPKGIQLNRGRGYNSPKMFTEC